MARVKPGATYFDEALPPATNHVLAPPVSEATGRRMARATARILSDDILYVPGITIDTVPVDAETYIALAAAGFIEPTPWDELPPEPTALAPIPQELPDGE